MSTVTVEVTQDDIDAALAFIDVPGTPIWCNCPVALAASRALGRKVGVQSDEIGAPEGEFTRMQVSPEDAAYQVIAELPLKAIARINLFDIERRMDPFSFELER